MSRRYESVFDDPDVAAELVEIHEKFVIVPADKASDTIVFVCKTHYINCLMEEFGMSTMTGNPTYNLTAMPRTKFYKKPPFGGADIRNFIPRGRYWPSQILLDS